MMSNRRFLCSGFEAEVRKQLVKKIKELRGSIISNLEATEDFTLICAEPKWTEKFITACCRGLWILLPEYVDDSHRIGKWLDERKYEWSDTQRLCLGRKIERLHLMDVPRGWRRRVRTHGQWAFHDWRVILLIDDLSQREVMSRTLTNGGASVFSRRQYGNEFILNSLTHIFVDKEFGSRRENLVSDLKRRGLPCYDVNFIVEFISQVGRQKKPDCHALHVLSGRGKCKDVSSQLKSLKQSDAKELESKVFVEESRSSNENRSRRDDRSLADDRVNIGSRRLQRSHLTNVQLPLMSCRQKEQLMNADALVALQSYVGGTGEISCPNAKSRGFDSEDKSVVTKKKAVAEVTLSDIPGPRMFINVGSVVLERLRNKLSNGFAIGRKSQAKRKSDSDSDMCDNLKKRKTESATEPPSLKPSAPNENVADEAIEDALPSAVSEIDAAPIGAEMSNVTAQPKLILRLRQSADNQWQLKENIPTEKRPVSEFFKTDDVADRTAVKQMVEEVARKQKLQKTPVTYDKHRVVLADSNRLKPEESNTLDESQRLADLGLKNNERNLFSVFSREISSLRESSDLASDFKSNEILPTVPSSNLRNDNLEIGNNGSCLRHEASSGTMSECILLGDDDEFDLVSSWSASLDVKKCLRSTCRPRKSSQPHNSESYPKASANISRRNAAEEETTASAPDETTSAVGRPKLRPWSSSVVALVGACLDDTTQSRSRFTTNVFIEAISGFCTPFSFVPLEILSVLLKKLVEECKTKGEFAILFYVLVEKILFSPMTLASPDVFPSYLKTVAQLYGHQKPSWDMLENLLITLLGCDENSDSLNVDLMMLRFVVKVLETDFQQSKEKLFSSAIVRGRSVRWCFLGQWLWTYEYAAVRSRNFTTLVALLVRAVCNVGKCSAELPVVHLVQKLVAMASECWAVTVGYSVVECLVPRDLWMIAVLVAEELAGYKIKCCDVKCFLETCEVDWLALFVCKILLDRMNLGSAIDNTSISLCLIVQYFRLHPFEEKDGSAVVDSLKLPASSSKCKPSAVTPIKSPGTTFKQTRTKASDRQILKLKDVNKCDSRGESMLHSACRRNKLKIVRELLGHPGIDVNLRDNAGWTPLHEACLHGNVGVVKELLSFKPNRTINSFFESLKGPPKSCCVDLYAASLAEGVTPLHDAVSNNQLDISRLLLQHGGRKLLDVVDKNGRRPYDYAKSDEMRFLLDEYDADQSSSQKKTKPSLQSRDNLSAGDSKEVAAIGADRPVSKDLSERYFLLAANLLSHYLSCRGSQRTEDDREIFPTMSDHLESFRAHVNRLQRRGLLTYQTAAFTRLEALVQFYNSF